MTEGIEKPWPKTSSRIEVIAKGNKTAEVLIYDTIGESIFDDGVTAKQLATDLKGLGKLDTVNVRINSPGGSVFEGLAIYNALVRNDARIVAYIDGLAASMAAVISQSGDEVNMADNALMMIHNPSAFFGGDINDLERMKSMLEKAKDSSIKALQRHSSLSDEELSELLNDETWMNAEEAKAFGFVHNITESNEVAATFTPPQNLRVPARVAAHFSDLFVTKPQEVEKMTTTETPTPVAATIKELKASLPDASAEFLCEQMEGGATLEQAKDAYMKVLQSNLAASEKVATEAEEKHKAELAKAKAEAAAKEGGVEPVGTGKTDSDGSWDNPRAEWLKGVREKVAAGMSRQRATSQMDKENPGLRQAMVEEANVGRMR